MTSHWLASSTITTSNHLVRGSHARRRMLRGGFCRSRGVCWFVWRYCVFNRVPSGGGDGLGAFYLPPTPREKGGGVMKPGYPPISKIVRVVILVAHSLSQIENGG